MEVRYIIDEDIPAAPKSALSMEDWGDQVYSLLASAMQVPRGKIYLDKKLEFKKYYGGYNTWKKPEDETRVIVTIEATKVSVH